MKDLALILLAACGASAPPAPVAPTQQPGIVLHIIMSDAALPCDAGVALGVHGLVTQPDGSPVPGVTVSVTGDGAAAATGITDDKGCYVVAVTKAGSVKVGVFYADVAHEQTTVVPSSGLARVDATLTPEPPPAPRPGYAQARAASPRV